MTIRDASYLALETAINQYLSLDLEISSQFSGLHGRCIGFDLRGTGIRLYFVPQQNGRLQLLSQLEGEPDCLVSGSVFSLLRSSREQGTESVFSGDVSIEGDSHLAQQFTDILLRVDVDWEEQLSRITGDVIAHEVGNQFRSGNRWLSRTSSAFGMNLQEYLQEELRLLPTVYELQEFYADVDQLRDGVERLAARLDLIHKTRSSK